MAAGKLKIGDYEQEEQFIWYSHYEFSD